MLGLTKGIDALKDSPVAKLKLVSTNMAKVFDNIKATYENIGKNIMQGLYDGLVSMESSLYSKAQSIADNIANTIKTALDIHSPSRVMFELGSFTMEGFQNGLENFYQPILHSLERFSRDLQLAPPPNDMGIFSRIKYDYAFSPEYPNDVMGYDRGYEQRDAETNTLLREQNELLRALLEKELVAVMDTREALADLRAEARREGYVFRS